MLFGSFFIEGVSAIDISNNLDHSEVAYFIPPKPENSIVNSVQINDVYVDENRIVYAVDRHAGGLYILEIEV